MTYSSLSAPTALPRRALITGAGSGLGRAIAIELARDSWELALCDINTDACEQTAEQVRAVGGQARVESLDISSAEQWTALVAKLKAQWPALDLLVNDAGVGAEGNIGDCPLADWQRVLHINLFGAIYGCHYCRDWLLARPNGAHVVNVASAAPFFCGPGMGAYTVSKAGVLALSETLYAELRPRGVGVTVVCPGFFPTNLLQNAHFQDEQQRGIAQRLMQWSPISAEDVARAAIKAMRRKQLYVVLPLRVRIFWRLRRLFPATMMRLVAWGAASGKAVLNSSERK
jgi:NAD(P)-dependent dehydrogenase (short-subunit alcohol dehydrogenase family)